MAKTLQLALSDFKLIFRDPSLRSFFVLPFLLLALVVWGFPYLISDFPQLETYLPIFMMVAVVENTQLYSFICSMVLIDEKETQVATVYGVSPISGPQFILARFLFPFLLTLGFNVLLLKLQPFYTFSFSQIAGLSFLAAWVVPVYALFINALVQNRMQGMAYIKGFNMIVLIPLAAYFVPATFKWAFAPLPTFWLFEAVLQVTKSDSFLLSLSLGTLYFLLLFGLSSRWFLRRHFS